MAAKKMMNVHEALEYLKNLQVSSEDDIIWRWGFHLKGKIGYFSSKRSGW